MKIDRTKLKKSSSEAPGDCGWLIEKITSCKDDELASILSNIDTWSFGKCELHHWVNVLDRFDSILEKASKRTEDVVQKGEDTTDKLEQKWVLSCDKPENIDKNQDLVVCVLYFTTLLVEHSFSRHLYSSVEHLIALTSSSSMRIVLAVLNLLYMFSKRSNFITRLGTQPRQCLLSRLIYLAESWGGKENGFGLAQCCKKQPLTDFPEGATTLHFEFYGEQAPSTETTGSILKSGPTLLNSTATSIHIENVQNLNKAPGEIMEDLLNSYKIPKEKQMVLFTHLRLAHSFARYTTRLQCVQARLQAISILVYCNALQDNAYTVLYSGLLDEFVEVLELQDPKLTEIKAATLRTLTSIIHLERLPNFPKLSTIIDVTGASCYHGFLPVLVRSCISSLTAPSPNSQPFPSPLATSLFSFLYHLASYESGGEALVACGMMDSLLQVVNWVGTEPEHITFVTRAVRVIDLITNPDMNAFQTHGGLNTFIKRLELEVNECRKEQPFVIHIPTPLGTEPTQPIDLTLTDQEAASATTDQNMDNPDQTAPNDSSIEAPQATSTPRLDPVTDESEVTTPVDSDMTVVNADRDAPRDSSNSPMDTTESNQTEDQSNVPETELTSVSNNDVNVGASTSSAVPSLIPISKPVPSVSCLPQRAALLKSMLNFLKKDIQDPVFSESMRHLMEGSLPASLKHIISNAEYYGPSLFLLATDVVTVYVLGEPSLLSSLQDNGLTDIVLQALLVKDVPATREVLGSLPNVFSALCLNTRGLRAFVACKPFERLFKVLLSPDYLPAMRRRRSSDPLGDTASNLGNAMDELMRHQPSLKVQAMKAIVKLLEEVCLLGSDAHYVCWKTPPKHEPSPLPTSRQTNDNSSDEEEEEEDGESGVNTINSQDTSMEAGSSSSGEKRPVPLVDYVLNVMKFVDAILSNNNTDDHCKEFVAQKGLVPLLGILGLSNLPIDFPASQACQAVASVCKSILNLAHESGVLQQGLQCLNDKLESLEPLHQPLPPPGGSVLLRELASSPQPLEAGSSPQNTPLLHTLSAIHAYIMMLVYVCRTGQTDIRQVSIKQWGTDLGLNVLKGLTKLYTSLVFESTVLLAMCSDGWKEMPDGLFGKDDGNRLIQPDSRVTDFSQFDIPMEITENTETEDSGGATSDSPSKAASQQQLKCIKPLLASASRLGKALAELFGLLVKLCVGSPLRQRRGQTVAPPLSAPSPAAVSVASALSHVLHAGLSWDPPPSSPLPKFRLTFLICSVRFTNPMLFDDKKMPYHLMIQHFVKSKSLDAFFDIFNWALSTMESLPLKLAIESSTTDKLNESNTDKDIKDGIGEFLDTWLFLLEKLVNPKTMLDSPHSLPSKQSFCPLKFLIHIQKLAFDAVLRLWNQKPGKNFNVSISESVLVILCSILKGEAIIKERLNKEKTSTSSAPPVSGASSTASLLQPVTAHSSTPASVATSGSGTSFPVIVSVASMASTLGNVSTNYLAPITSTDSSFPLHSSFILLSSSGSTSSVSSPMVTAASTIESSSTVSTVATSRPLMIPSPLLLPTDLSVGASPPQSEPAESSTSSSLAVVSTPASVSQPVDSVQLVFSTSEVASESSPLVSLPEVSAASNEEASASAVSSVVARLEEGSTVASSAAGATGSSIDFPYLQALLDMGFPQERCLEAVAHTTTLEQATEYLLSNPVGAQADGDMDFAEDDQWLQVMAMSLRENIQPVTSKPPTAPTRSEPLPIPQLIPLPSEEPLSKSRLDDFTAQVLEGCLTQLDHQPQLVYKACELLTTCVTRNGEKWKAFMLFTLMDQISEQACELKIIAFNARTPDTAEYLCTSETASKFGIRLHLVTLLFEEMKRGCAVALEIAGLIDILVDLVCLSELVMSANPNVLFSLNKDKDNGDSKKKTKDDTHTPKWLAPALLLLDLYEKLSVATKRRVAVKKVTNHIWKWFDLTAMKWYGYTQVNNTAIDDAYWNGEPGVRIVNGRRKYTIQFSNMMQINEETSNRRPVMISVSEKVIAEHKKLLQDVVTDDEKAGEKDKDAEKDPESEKDAEKTVELVKSKEAVTEEKMDTEEEQESKPKLTDEGFADSDINASTSEEKEAIKLIEEEEDKGFGGFAKAHRGKMVRACVGFMKLCVDPDTLHALMRLCLRLTRDWDLACLFSSLGGIRTLLSLTEKSAFWGFHNLAALLMRHVLEEPATLKHTMKKVVRYSAGSSAGIAAKELHSLLRVLAPVACRDSALFTDISQQCLRIDLSMAMKRNMVNTSSNEDGILMKSIGSKGGPGIAPGITDASEPQLLIHDLVEALAYSIHDMVDSLTSGAQGENTVTPSGTQPSTPSVSAVAGGATSSAEGLNLSIQTSTGQAHLSRSSSANDMVVVQDIDDQSPMESVSSPKFDPAPEVGQKSEEVNKKKGLLSKSTLCKLLAEFVRSYAGVAKLITEHQYSAGANERITEVCLDLSVIVPE